MPSANRVFTSASPWVVGREALLGEAVDNFLHEMTRQKPWLRARYEVVLDELTTHLSATLERPAPLSALAREHVDAWLKTTAERTFAERAVGDFSDYLVKWGWLDTHPLRQSQAV